MTFKLFNVNKNKFGGGSYFRNKRAKARSLIYLTPIGSQYQAVSRRGTHYFSWGNGDWFQK